MTDKMTLRDRLLNPAWTPLPGEARQLHIEQTTADMREAADRIDALMAHTGDPTQVAHLDGLKRYLAREITGRAMVTFESPLPLVTP